MQKILHENPLPRNHTITTYDVSGHVYLRVKIRLTS